MISGGTPEAAPMASVPTGLSKRGAVKLLKPAAGTEAKTGAAAETGTTVDDDPAMLMEILALLGALLGTLMGVAARRDIFLKQIIKERKKKKTRVQNKLKVNTKQGDTFIYFTKKAFGVKDITFK